VGRVIGAVGVCWMADGLRSLVFFFRDVGFDPQMGGDVRTDMSCFRSDRL